MAPRYQVRYLNLRGKAEPIRLLLHYVGEPFEDYRENYLEFAKYKDKAPVPKLPKLLIDGGKIEISYTNVILAYLGKKYGLVPQTEEEEAICETLAQRLQEYFVQIKPFVDCLLGLVPKEKWQHLLEKVFIPCIYQDFGPVFEKQLEHNGTGYLVGDS
ncbi:Protein GST-12, partial [Aphelenchoides avenae]